MDNAKKHAQEHSADILHVKIEKSELAQKLEEETGISWDLTQQFPFDAGYDVRACIELPTSIVPGRNAVIPTGLYFEMESPYWEIQVRPRSGLAAKKNIQISNSPGTVDYAYRDEVKIIIHNAGREPFHINPGDRIAQLCFRRVPQVHVEYVDKVEEAIMFSEDYDWSRAEKREKRGGFGSTGTS